MASGTRDITLVAVPSDSCCCVQFVSIPSGFFVLGQRWHKNIGQVDPGFKMCWPFFYRVSHIITRATVTYSAPSRQVPCADNVMVDINLSLTFSIGPSLEDAAISPPAPVYNDDVLVCGAVTSLAEACLQRQKLASFAGNKAGPDGVADGGAADTADAADVPVAISSAGRAATSDRWAGEKSGERQRAREGKRGETARRICA